MNGKWLLPTLAIAFLLAFTIRVENGMISQVRTMLFVPQEAMMPSLSDVSVSNNGSSSSKAMPRNNDWFQDEAWHDNDFTKECWHVEDICHSTHRWFYDSRSLNREHQRPFSISLYTPDQQWRSNYGGDSSSAFFLGRPKTLFVKVLNTTTFANEDDEPSDGEDFISKSFLEKCKYSTIPNHIVLQSYFNDMLGEFYARSLIYLYTIHNSASQPTLHTRSNSTKQFLAQTQMYLHVRGFPEHNKLLDSHHVFTDAFRSNPMLSFTYLLDYTGCRCMKRLFLCGYDYVNGDNKSVRGVFPTNLSENAYLIPAGGSGPDNLLKDYPNVLRGLRQHLRHSIIHSNPFVQQDIAKFRAKAIARHRPTLVNLTRQEIQEFRIIGLTQRKGRRKWLLLHDIIRQCNTEWFDDADKIVCVEINMEKDDVNPVRQVVIHAACDMLFGIHGAQLTEAIWMKDASVVVELLPWIPDTAIYGTWTRTTNTPTPLGIIFSESPLNHIGYRLPRESAPHCLDKTDPAELKECFSNFLWDERDFQTHPETIHATIRRFAPRLGSSKVVGMPSSCDELQEQAGDRVYVLYNVICSNQTNAKDNGNNDTAALDEIYHFYWPA